ncbi:MAG: T9SS type A sorting domain-containing protein [Flavobacteriales bacterium]|nr:T9SS type A sorting domain-containing protein [Flavobacteriales bacterium]
MNPARIILCLLVLAFQGEVDAQTFSTRFHFGLFSYATSVFEVNTGYLVTGVAAQNNGGIHTEYFISHFDSNGVQTWSEMYGSIDSSYAASWDASVQLSNSNFIHASRFTSSSGISCAVLAFNDLGEFSHLDDFSSPYAFNEENPDDWIAPTCIRIDEYQNVFVGAIINTPENTFNNPAIFKWNEEQGVVWVYALEDDSYFPIFYSFEFNTIGPFFIVNNVYLDSPSNSLFVQLDFEGNLVTIEEVATYRVFDILSISNSEFVAAISLFDDPVTGMLPAIWKFNDQGKTIWTSQVIGVGYAWEQEANDVILCQDGGYLLSANYYDEWPQDPEDGPFNKDAMIAKFSSDGAFEWKRIFNIIEAANDKNRIYDLKATSDGGYIFCGEATGDHFNETQPTQQAWVVKVDEYGCLIPRCQVSVEEFSQENGMMKVAPNPTRDFINVFVSHDVDQAQLEVVDGFGRILDSTSLSHGGTTYLFDCSQYATGHYLVRLVSEHLGVLEVERVVVE